MSGCVICDRDGRSCGKPTVKSLFVCDAHMDKLPVKCLERLKRADELAITAPPEWMTPEQNAGHHAGKQYLIHRHLEYVQRDADAREARKAFGSERGR